MLRSAIIVCLFALTACSGSGAPQFSAHELTGGGAERVVRMSTAIDNLTTCVVQSGAAETGALWRQ